MRKSMTSCKHCGCHEQDACFHPEHGNCWWVNEGECSHCLEVPGEGVRWSLLPKSDTKSQLLAAYKKVIEERKTKQPDSMKKYNSPKLFLPTIDDEKRVAGILSGLFSTNVGVKLSDGTVVQGEREKLKVVSEEKKGS